MASNIYPVYEARVKALGSVRAWHIPESDTYSLTYFNGEEYTPLFLSEEAAYYTWLFLSMLHPEANAQLGKCSIKPKSKCRPAPKKPATKKKKLVKKK